jgi:hypothetical protein
MFTSKEFGSVNACNLPPDDGFISSNNVIYTFWYVMMCTTAVRFKYYFAWLLADAIVNNAGLGFNGFDIDGTPKWDLFTNIYVIPFEVSKKIIIVLLKKKLRFYRDLNSDRWIQSPEC